MDWYGMEGQMDGQISGKANQPNANCETLVVSMWMFSVQFFQLLCRCQHFFTIQCFASLCYRSDKGRLGPRSISSHSRTHRDGSSCKWPVVVVKERERCRYQTVGCFSLEGHASLLLTTHGPGSWPQAVEVQLSQVHRKQGTGNTAGQRQ